MILRITAHVNILGDLKKIIEHVRYYFFIASSQFIILLSQYPRFSRLLMKKDYMSSSKEESTSSEGESKLQSKQKNISGANENINYELDPNNSSKAVIKFPNKCTVEYIEGTFPGISFPYCSFPVRKIFFDFTNVSKANYPFSSSNVVSYAEIYIIRARKEEYALTLHV